MFKLVQSMEKGMKVGFRYVIDKRNTNTLNSMLNVYKSKVNINNLKGDKNNE